MTDEKPLHEQPDEELVLTPAQIHTRGMIQYQLELRERYLGQIAGSVPATKIRLEHAPEFLASVEEHLRKHGWDDEPDAYTFTVKRLNADQQALVARNETRAKAREAHRLAQAAQEEADRKALLAHMEKTTVLDGPVFREG